MKKQKKSGLSLSVEAIRNLSARQLRDVAGALPMTNRTDVCGTDTCDCGTGANSVCLCVVAATLQRCD